MKSFHVRRNFLKLAKRIGLIGFSAFGAGTVVSLGTAQSAQSKQISDSEQMQELLDRIAKLEQKLVQRPSNEPTIQKVEPINDVIVKPTKPREVFEKLPDTPALEGFTGKLLNVGSGEKTGLVHIFGGPKGKSKRPTIELIGGSDVGNALMIKSNAHILLDGEKGNIDIGGNGVSGRLVTKNSEGKDTALIKDGIIDIGGNGGMGLLTLKNAQGQNGIVIAGGNDTAGGLLSVSNVEGSPGVILNGTNTSIDLGKSIRLDGKAGDIILQNADCAEEFDVAEVTVEVEPGTVMVIDQDGKIRQSEGAYDKCVAGVISGAGDYKPGIILDRKQSETKRLPIALVGKVYCKVDATYGAIQVGDLLTTSPTLGHAMKVNDPLKGFGAVLGKALRPLEAGQGLIPVLVALQ